MGRYAMLQLRGFIPLIAAAPAGLIGYMLGPALRKATPNNLLVKLFPQKAEQLECTLSANPQVNDIANAMLKDERVQSHIDKAFNVGGASVGAFIGAMAGSLPLGYDVWRKAESSRIAAREINHDISQMRMIVPSDESLIKENQRLRAMLDEKTPASPERTVSADSIASETLEPNRSEREKA